MNLADGGLPSKYESGKGGWPTVRYFNAETGYDGKPYEQKTQKSMCDELGDLEYMRAYVEDKSAKPCNAVDADMPNCSEKERKFVTSWKAKSSGERANERARLDKIGANLIATKEVMAWHKQRTAILKQLIAAHDEL